MRQCLNRHQEGIWEVPRPEPKLHLVIREITSELQAFGAVVGPKFTRCATQEAEGIEVSQLDLQDAVASEIFCRNRFTSRAPSFGLHPRFAIDYSTGWDLDEPDQEVEAFKLRETMPPMLLVGPPERKTWNQPPNLLKTISC